MQVARLAALLALAATAAGELIVLEPLVGKTGAEKVMVLINGAFVPNTNYVEVSEAMQEASPLKLWVAIPSFPGDCPNPVSINSKTKQALDAVAEAGFTANGTTDVVLAGHSLGGIFAQLEAVKGDYTGLVLLGSYITTANGYTVDTYPKPALTLAGEIDGLTRITRVAQSWRERRTLLASADAIADTPYLYAIPTLPSVTHSQFCSNVNVTSFGTSDLCPEISWADAHAAIGDMVAAYLAVLFGTEDELPSARDTLDKGMDVTTGLIDGFLDAQDAEAGAWCAAAQQLEVDNATLAAVPTVTVDDEGSAVAFDAANPSINVAANSVVCVNQDETKANPTDASTTPVAATELDCKEITSAGLAAAFGVDPTTTAASTDCASRNTAALSWANSVAAASTLDRWAAKGKPFAVAPDTVCSSGASWKATDFSFDDAGDQVVVTSPRLTTDVDDSSYPGEQLCKYLSAAHVLEYMMVDGVPTYDDPAC